MSRRRSSLRFAAATEMLGEGAPAAPPAVAGIEKPTTFETGRRGFDEDAEESDDWSRDAHDFFGPGAGFGAGAAAAEVEGAGAGALGG